MNFQIAALTNLPALGGVEQFRFMRRLRQPCEHRASGAGHPGLQSLGAEPFDGVGDRGTKSLGNRLQVVSALVDCDDDTVLLKVQCLGSGNVCHTGERTCFFREIPAATGK